MRRDPPFNPHPHGVRLSTPHARGSTRLEKRLSWTNYVYPACAGIHPGAPAPSSASACLPRMRGDPPVLLECCAHGIPSTPHARGSTAAMSGKGGRKMVYPACAGIHPLIDGAHGAYIRLPRMRGDPPVFDKGKVRSWMSTPHARGSTTYFFWYIQFAGSRMRGDPFRFTKS